MHPIIENEKKNASGWKMVRRRMADAAPLGTSLEPDVELSELLKHTWERTKLLRALRILDFDLDRRLRRLQK
ncbi:MAG: hypothetical protein LBD58_00595 [Treponema sp.]|nr:hypothetical protein [Treponema sp.]